MYAFWENFIGGPGLHSLIMDSKMLNSFNVGLQKMFYLLLDTVVNINLKIYPINMNDQNNISEQNYLITHENNIMRKTKTRFCSANK